MNFLFSELLPIVILSELFILYTFIFLTKIPAFASLINIFFESFLILSKFINKKLALLKFVSILKFFKS